MAQRTTPGKAGKVTPLWIVAGFLGLTETVVAIAVTQVTGTVQGFLTAFVIIFPSIIAFIFFRILWHRPYVLYPPSEYGNADPKKFVEAISQAIPPRVAEQITKAEEVESRPDDLDAQFRLMDSLIEGPTKQIVILMHEKSLSVSIGGRALSYETGDDGTWASGGFSGEQIAQKLDGTELLDFVAKNMSVRLSQRGHEFARWLVNEGRRAAYLTTPLGGWGEVKRPAGLPPQFVNPPSAEQMGMPSRPPRPAAAAPDSKPPRGTPTAEGVDG